MKTTDFQKQWGTQFTSKEQSKILLQLGLSPLTADNYFTPYNPCKPTGYYDVPDWTQNYYKDCGEYHIPCWSLARLIEILTDMCGQISISFCKEEPVIDTVFNLIYHELQTRAYDYE